MIINTTRNTNVELKKNKKKREKKEKEKIMKISIQLWDNLIVKKKHIVNKS